MFSVTIRDNFHEIDLAKLHWKYHFQKLLEIKITKRNTVEKVHIFEFLCDPVIGLLWVI